MITAVTDLRTTMTCTPVQYPDGILAHRSSPLMGFVQTPLGAYLGVARIGDGICFTYEGANSYGCTARNTDLGSYFMGGAKAVSAEALLGLLCVIPVELEFCRGYGQAYVVLKWPLAPRGSFAVEVPWIEPQTPPALPTTEPPTLCANHP